MHTDAGIIMYADDTVLLVEKGDPALATKYMQEVLDYTGRWCQLNRMTVNAKKTKNNMLVH